MKKKLIGFISVFVMAISTVSIQAQAINEYTDIPVAINDNVIEKNAISIDGRIFIPIRAAAEAAGLEVIWQGENKSVVVTNSAAIYITFTIGNDGYTFAKTAPMKLGAAPIITDGCTYVPVELFSQLLDYDCSLENSLISINTEKQDFIEGTGTVLSADDGRILFKDTVRDEVLLAPSEDTIITDSDGNIISLEDIAEGDSLIVEYGKAMTMSIPPLNNPVSVTLVK